MLFQIADTDCPADAQTTSADEKPYLENGHGHSKNSNGCGADLRKRCGREPEATPSGDNNKQVLQKKKSSPKKKPGHIKVCAILNNNLLVNLNWCLLFCDRQINLPVVIDQILASLIVNLIYLTAFDAVGGFKNDIELKRP